jgi:hypothetical protein
LGETSEEQKPETQLEPLEDRKSRHKGPAYVEVKHFFVELNNRPEAEAITFWNEYEQKEWWVHNKEGTPARKMKTGRDWQLKAEQWIYKARTTEMEKKKNGRTKQNSSGASNEFLAKLSTDRAIRERQGK